MSESEWEPWSPDGTEYETLRLARKGQVARITFDNPATLNSLTRNAFAEIPHAAQQANGGEGIDVLVLTGAGRGFSSGADLTDFLGRRVAEGASLTIPDKAGRELPLLAGVDIPVIAAVNGPAAGAGLILALLADFRIASTEAFFVESHVARGLTPSVGPWLLPRLVGLGKATEMVLLGRRVYAAEALACGLVNQVVEPGELGAAVDALAAEILALPTFAVRTAKGSLRRALDASLDDVREWAGAMEALSLAMSDEAVHGVAKGSS